MTALEASVEAVHALRSEREYARRVRSQELWGHPGAWCQPYPPTTEEEQRVALAAIGVDPEREV